jgi:hypothetical protein
MRKRKNNKRYQENPQLYRTRQEINEHIFGTIKRQWGYNHTNLTGLEKSKWGTQFNYAGIQHQTLDQYTACLI